AVEKDPEHFNFLNQKYAAEAKSGKLVLSRADIRDVLKFPKRYSIYPKRYKVVANIPYYLTGRLLRIIFEGKNIPDLAILMLQKEVAQRIAPQTRFGAKMSILAISVQVFAKPKIAFYVPRRNFRPEPEVDSAVIILERHKKDFFRSRGIDRKLFLELVKKGFSQKRKKLSNNIKDSVKIEHFAECGLETNARAEDLSLENWACLAGLSTLKKPKNK
ncbi:MAG: hypothetical protein HY446_01120, partial [Candidatus Niyogibacteria bacterium]|nr:hypothetical protein [Candidatus Niyogibacteria bacterium]